MEETTINFSLTELDSLQEIISDYETETGIQAPQDIKQKIKTAIKRIVKK